MNSNHINPASFFQKQVDDYSAQLFSVKQTIRKTSILRISVFLITVLGIYLASSTNGWMVLGISMIGLSFFAFLVIKHVRLFQKKTRLERLLQINKNELLLLVRNTKNQLPGTEYLSVEHPFAVDLDVFGEGSLFQLLDRSATQRGRDLLAEGLLAPDLSSDVILKRQQAIAELQQIPLWRQEFQAIGTAEKTDKLAIDNLLRWSGIETGLWNKPIYKILIVITPLLGLGTVVLINLGILSFGAFLMFLLLPLIVLGSKLSTINREHDLLGKKTELLGKYATLFEKIESQNFHSELLKKEQLNLSTSASPAALAFKQLRAISKAFDYRLNILIGIPLDIFFLWDILQLMRLEKWKKTYGKEMPHWFDALSKVDDLCSFAGFAFQHTEAIFPDLINDFGLEGKNVKHPFIATQKCVGNPINIQSWAQFQIITGANMAGKSTYLRTIGVNLLLAMCGAPVLADRFVFKPVQLFTGIKTSDSLQDGESYFFAELKRLQEIIQRLEKGEKLFIILDEILRGTNSKDKQKGSRALLRQLIRLGASGLVATHDLALGGLADDFPENIVNKRFEVEIENNQLVFDYQLKEGISQNLNATFLMKKMGITL